MVNAKQKYFCIPCNMHFGYPEKGKVKCPTCGWSREDNLNQVDKHQYECIQCNLIFSDISEKPICPNGC